MRNLRTILALSLPVLATALWTLSPARATTQEGISLLKTLDPWKYPSLEDAHRWREHERLGGNQSLHHRSSARRA